MGVGVATRDFVVAMANTLVSRGDADRWVAMGTGEDFCLWIMDSSDCGHHPFQCVAFADKKSCHESPRTLSVSLQSPAVSVAVYLEHFGTSIRYMGDERTDRHGIFLCLISSATSF